MKRILALLLTVLLLPWAALAEGAELSGGKTATRTGPGTQYTEELGTLAPPLRLTVIGRVDDGAGWYHVEYTRGQKLYRVYVLKSRVKNAGDAPVENNELTPDVTLEETKAYYGPGEEYAARPGKVAANTEVRVAGVEGEWALCDYREDWRWARGYLPVSCLANTTIYSPALIQQVQPTQESWTVLPEITEEPWTVLPDITEAPVSAVGGEALNAEELPFVNVAAFLSLAAPVNIYSGPGEQYAVQTTGEQVTASGILYTSVRAYGLENGWVLIRYSSGESGEFRYGWAAPAALAGADQTVLPNLAFARTPAVVARAMTVADDPDILASDGPVLEENNLVTALACLNSDPSFVYCEYTRWVNGQPVPARGFLPAEDLRGI